MGESARTSRSARNPPAIGTAAARALRLAIFDVDGVMTDGRLYIGPDGEEMKVFHVLDGHGLKSLSGAGIEVAILSGRRSRPVEVRAAELGIRHVIQGAADKLVAFEALLRSVGCSDRETSFMGDDLPDVAVMKRCRIAITVPDAPAQVKRIAHIVTRRAGGRGAVREAADLILQLRASPRQPRGSRR